MIGDDSHPETGPARPGSCLMVIFGATGDLGRRLLTPAVYNLAAGDLLPERFAVLGVSGSELSDDELRRRLTEAIRNFTTVKDSKTGESRLDPAIWDKLVRRVHYMPGAFDDPETYRRLAARLAELDVEHGTEGNVLFYLATPDKFFALIIRRLGEAGLLAETQGWRRVVIEKPFGHDLASARALNREILHYLREEQIFRIDHYLGKETVQNIMALRFGNGFFEPIWKREHIDHVQISACETVGVERRGRFYDATGALRDMVPNHVFQLFSMVAMEPPISFHADAVRGEKAKVLAAIHRFGSADALDNVVRGQYAAGTVGDRAVKAYRDEPDVSSKSETETYVAMKIMVDTWRWAGVPFYLRTGKALGARRTEIAIRFKQAPFTLFRDTPVEKLAPNWLVLRIQPDEGVAFYFGAKIPGPTVRLGRVKMDFNYRDYFAASPSTGYETLIYDCMIGDAILFQRADGIEAGWRVVQPFLDAWRNAGAAGLATYPAGSDGPQAADELLARDGRRWRPLE